MTPFEPPRFRGLIHPGLAAELARRPLGGRTLWIAAYLQARLDQTPAGALAKRAARRCYLANMARIGPVRVIHATQIDGRALGMSRRADYALGKNGA